MLRFIHSSCYHKLVSRCVLLIMLLQVLIALQSCESTDDSLSAVDLSPEIKVVNDSSYDVMVTIFLDNSELKFTDYGSGRRVTSGKVKTIIRDLPSGSNRTITIEPPDRYYFEAEAQDEYPARVWGRFFDVEIGKITIITLD